MSEIIEKRVREKSKKIFQQFFKVYYNTHMIYIVSTKTKQNKKKISLNLYNCFHK